MHGNLKSGAVGGDTEVIHLLLRVSEEAFVVRVVCVVLCQRGILRAEAAVKGKAEAAADMLHFAAYNLLGIHCLKEYGKLLRQSRVNKLNGVDVDIIFIADALNCMNIADAPAGQWS